VGKISDTEIGVQSHSRCNFLAEWQVPLIANNAVAGAFIAVARRGYEAKSRRERGLSGSFFERLVAVIQKEIADTALTISFVYQVIKRDCVGKLVILPIDWPFLGEGKSPTALPGVIAIDRLKNILH
jgi:hypothetical protein